MGSRLRPDVTCSEVTPVQEPHGMRSLSRRRPLGLPLPSAVLEVADQFLLLGVHRDDWLAPPLIRLDPSVDVLELGVAVGMAAAFPGLAVGLEAVTELAQQGADRPGTDRVTLAVQLDGQLGGTLASPAQRRLGGRHGPTARPTPPGRPSGQDRDASAASVPRRSGGHVGQCRVDRACRRVDATAAIRPGWSRESCRWPRRPG